MKKEILLIFLLLVLVSCVQKETEKISPIQIHDQNFSAEKVIEDGESITEDKEDLAFNLPPDKDSSGWTQTLGPLGGVVIRMIPHAGTIWASLYSGGIYELQPDDSWKQIAVGYGIPEVRAFDIVADPSNVNIAYVPEMIACVAKTTNKGVSWQGLCDQVIRDIEAPNFNSHTLALDPENSKILYVPGHTHDQTSMLIVSTDSGEHWEKRFTFEKHYDFNHLFFFDSKMYLATRDDGVLVSSDKGKSWTPFNNGLKDLKTARFVNFKNSLYLLGAQLQFNSRFGGKIYQRTSDGSAWKIIPGLDEVTGIGADENYLYAATWNPDPKLWVSSDGNTFAERASQGLPPGWVGEIVPHQGTLLVGPNGNGIYISKDNGNTFEEFNKDVISIATREVYVNPEDENEIYVGTWDQLGFYWSKNGGKGYKRLATDSNVFTLRPDPNNFSRVYLGSEQFAVGSVSKEGSSFLVKIKPGTRENTIIKSIAIDPTDSNHILVGIGVDLAEAPPGEGLWESHDGAESWIRTQGIGNFAVYSIIFNPNDPRIVYASALGEGVFKSTDGGSHFTSLGTDQLKYTYRLAMSLTDPKVMVASSNVFFAQLSSEEQVSGKYGGIFQTRDGGVTWKELTAGIRNYEGNGTNDFLPWLYNLGHLPNYENILIDPKNPDHLVVGHHGENVVETTDGGATWKKAGAGEMVPGGIHNYAYCLGASPSFKKFYACTCGRGLFLGVMNEKGYIALSLTGDAVYTGELEDYPQPRNAQEARELILSGEYNHQH